MITKKLQSKITIGTWQIAGDYWGKQSHSDSLKMIHAALRAGFIHFDTSPDYGKGKSEQLLGQQLNSDCIISTKSFIKPAQSVEKNILKSLKRLNREYIDYFFIHWPSTKLDCKPMMEQLENLKAKGVIRNIGVSNFNLEQLNDIRNAGNIDIVQNAYNFFWLKDQAFLEYCHNNKIKTQGYSTLAQGLLTGKFNYSNPWVKEDDRFKMVLFNKNNLPIVYKYIEKLLEISKNNNISLFDLIIKWTLSKTFLDTFIIGCRTRKQIEDLEKISNLELPNSALEQLEIISQNVSLELKLENNIFNHAY